MSPVKGRPFAKTIEDLNRCAFRVRLSFQYQRRDRADKDSFSYAAFAVFGTVLKPKSFAGLFGAAPSVALATLALTVATDGKSYAAIEARSMLA